MTFQFQNEKKNHMNLSWYVLHCKPNKENLLYSQLLFRDFDVFYPRIKVKPVNPRSRKNKPFFPGYVFVRTDFNITPVTSLLYLPGINRIVSFDGEPAVVPDSVIQIIKTNVECINENPNAFHSHLQHGDPVIIQGGPFDGFQAIFDARLEGSDRVRLLIKLLHGQQKRVQMPETMIKPKIQSFLQSG